MEGMHKYIPLSYGVDYIIDNRGKTPAKLGSDWANSGVRVISAKNVHSGKLDNLDSIRFVSNNIYKKWMKIDVQRNDIFVASEGASIGESMLWDSDEKIVLGQRLFGIRCNPDILDPFYLAMYMQTPEYRKEYENYSTGTSVLGISQPSLLKTRVLYLPIQQQRMIGSLYKTLNDKIALNNRINHNLEEQAQALYKSWFVDFEPFNGEMPDTWKLGLLSDILRIKRNSIKADDIGNEPYLPIDIIPMRKLSIDSFAPSELAQSSLQSFQEDDIVIGAMRVYFHRVVIAPCSGVTRNTCFVLEPYNKDALSYCLCVCNDDSTIDYAQNTSKGSTMPYAVWDNGLGNMDITIPDNESLSKFHRILYPVLTVLKNSYREQSRLVRLRDSILPKLMSGELNIDKKGC